MGVLVAVAGALVVVALVVLGVLTFRALTTVPTAVPTSPNPVSSPVIDADAARDVLAALPLVDAAASAPYQRDRFGERWADVEGNGCDTRNDVLARDLTAPVFRPGTGECKVLEGELIDPYDGHIEAFVSGEQTSPLVQIDHIVALAWAWRHGADGWTDAERVQFANDPVNLVATADENNEAKSDSGPAEWMPPAAWAQCGFVIAWVHVLGVYELGINADDRRAAERVLDDC